MDQLIEQIAVLLLIAAIVAMAARRMRLPYASGLVVAGIAIGLAPIAPQLALTRDVIYSVLLPPLIFEAALSLPWAPLKQQLAPVVVLASGGLVLAAGVTAWGMATVAGWPPIAAALFGALISATDPVSVIALFRETRMPGRLPLLVEAESLFNDATAAVLFGLVVTTWQVGAPGAGAALAALASTVLGSVACGALVALPVTYLSTRSTDHLVGIVTTIVAAYASFLLAEHLHWSGVLSTMTAGLIVARRRVACMLTEHGRVAVEAFWEAVAFLANSLVFLLIGVHMARQPIAWLGIELPIAVAFVLLGRAASVYPVSALFLRSRWALDWPEQHVLFWGGLRGALALGLALGLPADVPYREHIVTTSFAVVTFSLLIQGPTITPLIRALRLASSIKQEK